MTNGFSATLGRPLQVFRNLKTAQKLLGGYLNGSQSFTEDLKGVLTRPAVDSEALKNLSITAVLSQMLSKMEDGQRSKMQNLITKAKELGL